MTFHNPEYLFLLLALIPMIGWYVWEVRKSDASIQISSIKKMKDMPKTMRLRMRHLPFILRLLSIGMLVLAIARPQSSLNWRKESKEGIDIVMALDISGTMMAEDLRPSRLEAAKNVAIDFIQSRPNDNIGLVVFAAESFTQCPLTTDHAVLVNLFSGIRYGMIEDGTAIGLGLANAVSRIKESKAKSKVVILLTDGSNNRGDIAPVTAAEIAKTFGIRVYTIGVGAMGMAPYPVMTPFGVDIQQVKVEIDEPLLQQIATETGGKYFRATDNTKLLEIYGEINKMEKSRTTVDSFPIYKELFMRFALIALVAFALEILFRLFVIKRIP